MRKRKTIKKVTHWCMNCEGHPNGMPHGYYVTIAGPMRFWDWVNIKRRRKIAVLKACPVCHTKKHVALGRIVTKELHDE